MKWIKATPHNVPESFTSLLIYNECGSYDIGYLDYRPEYRKSLVHCVACDRFGDDRQMTWDEVAYFAVLEPPVCEEVQP